MTSRFFGVLSVCAVLTFELPAEAQKSKDLAGKCLTCHKQVSPGLYQQWYESSHATHQVTCIDCHGAERGDVDGFDHNGARIAVLVTPKDCGVCHATERDQVGRSHHAKAGQILESN
ncbi:cytochrome C552, partial [candidate division KSB1 bacterium]|nr:cytochrome C552 [candidate division KSB1 bacterium]